MAFDQSSLFRSVASNFLAFASGSFGLLDLAGEHCRNFSNQGLFRPNARVATPRIGLDNQNLLLVWHLATIKVSFDRVALIFLAPARDCCHREPRRAHRSPRIPQRRARMRP
jgi:hypothetical protein